MSEPRIAIAGTESIHEPQHHVRPGGLRQRIRTSASRFGRAPRLMGIDIARGLAVFGMIGAHVGNTAWLDWGDPTTWSGIVNGRSSILFALLAGISIALATGGREVPTGEALRTARLRMAGRALAILTIGLILEMMGTPLAVILPVYGVLFLIILPFIGWSRRALIVTSLGIAVLAPVSMAVLSALMLNPNGPGLGLVVTGVYPLQTWLAMMLCGIAIGRSDLTTVRAGVRLLAVGAVLAVGGYSAGSWAVGSVDDVGFLESGADSLSNSIVSVPGTEVDLTGFDCMVFGDGSIMCLPEGAMTSSDMMFGMEQQSWRQQFDAMGGFSYVRSSALAYDAHTGGTLEIIGSGGFAMAVVGFCLLASRALRPVLIPIAAVGSMPLTAYSAHVISYAILLQPFALIADRFGGGIVASNGFWLANVATLLVVCTVWALTMGRGPLERVTAWAARSLSAAPTPTRVAVPTAAEA